MSWTTPSCITPKAHALGGLGRRVSLGSRSVLAPEARRARWAAGLALATGLGLLWAFNLVVQQGVEQGAARRLTTAMQAEEGWRCGTAKGARARSECLLGAPGTRLASQNTPP